MVTARPELRDEGSLQGDICLPNGDDIPFIARHSRTSSTACWSVDSLWDAVGRIIDTYTPAESSNYVATAGYLQPDRLTL